MLREAVEYLRSRQKVTLVLAAANIIVFILLSIKGDTTDAVFMLAHGACYTPKVLNGEYWRLFTSMFMHFGLPHLLYNTVALLALGDILEGIAGHIRFTLIYILGGLAGNLLSTWVDIKRSGPFAVSAGASGAVFAGIGGLLCLVVTNRYVSERIRPERFGIVVVLMVAQGFYETGTNNIAHIGGLAAGFLLAAVLFIRGIKKY